MTGTVLVVTSGKGGVGKTTTTLNLGVALRGKGHSVALVDGDLGMANLATMLGIETPVTLHDVLAGRATIQDATLEEADEFGIVPGARDLEAFASIDPGELPGALTTLAEGYEYVVVDAGPGVHYESTLPIEAADEIVLVTTPANTAVADTAKVAELAGMMDCGVRGAVINRATDGTESEGIAAELGVDLLAVVPESSAVRESTDAGVPIERFAPDSPAAAAYRGLADVLTEGEESPASEVLEATPGDESAEGGAGAPEASSSEAAGSEAESDAPGGPGESSPGADPVAPAREGDAAESPGDGGDHTAGDDDHSGGDADSKTGVDEETELEAGRGDAGGEEDESEGGGSAGESEQEDVDGEGIEESEQEDVDGEGIEEAEQEDVEGEGIEETEQAEDVGDAEESEPTEEAGDGTKDEDGGGDREAEDERAEGSTGDDEESDGSSEGSGLFARLRGLF